MTFYRRETSENRTYGVKSNVITFYQVNIPSFKSNAIKSFNKLRNISYHKRDKQKGYGLTTLGEILDKVYKDI